MRQTSVVGRMSSSPTTRPAKSRWRSALVGALLVGGLASAPSAFASTGTGTGTVNLGQAAGYAVISGASIANTGASEIRGDIGAPVTPSGFGPGAGVLDGTMRVGSAATTAYNDFLAAYNEVLTRPAGASLPPLAGATLTPGLYTATAAAGMAASTVLTLDARGNPNAVFVIQVNGALSLGAGAQVRLAGGAQASNVFWQVTGAFSVGAPSGGTPAQFEGTVMASTTATIGAGALVNGRVFAETAVTTDSDEFFSAAPTMRLDGGAANDVNDSLPTISGTTNVGTAGVVSVTVAGQTMTATPSALDGSWSVTPTILANGTYQVLASTVDGAGNVASASQQLTIDTVAPHITLNGAPSVLTSNPTMLISGTTDAAVGTLIAIDVEAQTLTAVVNGTTITQSVGQQTLAAVVQSNGTWNVSPGLPMGQGSRTVTASVTDPAGNVSTATEQVDVETVAPTSTSTPTPTPSRTPTSTATPPTKAPPTAPQPTPAPQAPKQVSLSSHTLTAQHPVKVGFTLAKPGTVQLKLTEMVHGKAKVVGTVTIKDHKAGPGSYTLTRRFAGHQLGKGSYTLSLQITNGKHHSRAITRRVSVR
jgi:hypothetical protein